MTDNSIACKVVVFNPFWIWATKYLLSKRLKPKYRLQWNQYTLPVLQLTNRAVWLIAGTRLTWSMVKRRRYTSNPDTFLQLAKWFHTTWLSARSFPLPYRLRYVRSHTLMTQQNLKWNIETLKSCCYRNVINVIIPKHMPQSPVNIVNRMTQVASPISVSPKIEKLNMSTNVVWPHIITNWVATWENRISMPVIPITRHRSSIPSLRSINMAPDVNATDKKKIMVKITPGAAKSVKFGVWSP